LRVELVKLYVNCAKRENQSLLESHPANIFPMWGYLNLKDVIIEVETKTAIEQGLVTGIIILLDTASIAL